MSRQLVMITAYGMPWKTPHEMITTNTVLNELALMCERIFSEKSDKIKKYVGGLPNMIHGSVMASKPKTMQDTIEIATELMDKKISTLAKRQAENKRKLDNNNHAQQQPPKKQVGHLTQDCRSPAATNNQRNPTCYECGNQGHYRSDCPKLKNQNHGNQAGGMFKGVTLSSSLQISHMFYAYDTVFVGQWNDVNIDTIIHVLECFFYASSMRINRSKSKLMGIVVEDDKVELAASKIGCLTLKPPFSYLGSKVGGLMSRVQSWNEVVDRVISCLSNSEK
ncbi:putative reverse transcriptase domain-containing protein [Tanacetum coccineum]